MIFGLLLTISLLLGSLLISILSNHDTKVAMTKKILAADAEAQRWQDLYGDIVEDRANILEGRDARESHLRRALEDLEESEIDRARFTLDIVYGKNR